MSERDAVDRRRRLRELLNAALDLAPVERAALLERADDDVRAEAERLLAHRERAEDFLERPAAEYAAPLLSDAGTDGERRILNVPERVGPYRILREIGHGGMGRVFLAEREDPQLHQRVALKVLAGLPGEVLVQRFLDERRILAALEHGSIAHLLDGGVTEEGLPWFAMEYVEGTAIHHYCEERGLGTEARLRLFLQVCDAVQYAHQALVVHRDLKPSNILVTEEGRVKLLDFGIAKLLAPGGRGGAGLTRTGPRPMTPEYASPEQVRGDPVSTASDVYALGVLLYRLLAGVHPHDATSRMPHELARAVLEEDPPSPSTRGTGAVRRRLRGDIDAIVLTALRKEPGRRYATVEKLAEDVRRHLGGQPVTARPNTWRYRTGKFVRRHRAAVAATAAFAALLVVWGATATAQAGRIARETARTEQVKDFLADLFLQASPVVTRGEEPTASDLVDQGARRVAAELGGQPELQAEMMTLLGNVYLALGDYRAAIAQLEPALRTRRALHGDEHEDVAETAQILAAAHHYEGRFREAERLLRETVAIRRTLSGVHSREMGEALNDLGDMLHTRGEYGAAEDTLRSALRVLTTATGERSEQTARARRDLANVLRDRGSHEEAEPLYRRALDVFRERHGRVHPVVARTENDLARLLAESGGHREADSLLRGIMATYEQLYPEGHPMVGTTLRNLGILRLRQGRPEEAAESLRGAVTMYRRTLGPASAFIPRAQRYLAEASLGAGDTAAAIAAADEAVEALRALGLVRHPALGEALRVRERARAGSRP